MALEFTTSNFQTEVLDSDSPVLVDFWAAWCGPCRRIGPIIDELATDNPDLKIGKLDVDASQEIAIRYGVSNIPSILIFKGGEVVETTMGVQSKDVLQGILNRHKA